MKKKILLLCKHLYFSLPCIKYSGACGWKYYMDVLNIYIDPAPSCKEFPKWYKPWVQKLDNYFSSILLKYMVKNKDILKEDYYSTTEELN